MKNLENLGKVLKTVEQKTCSGGSHPGTRYVCIDSFPFTYDVGPGQLCNDGSVPLCA